MLSFRNAQDLHESTLNSVSLIVYSGGNADGHADPVSPHAN